MENPISMLHNHLAKMAGIYGKPIPKINYEFEFNDSIKGYRCQLVLFNQTFVSDFYVRKKQAKEAVSAVALRRITENDVIKPCIPIPVDQPICSPPLQMQQQSDPRAQITRRIHAWLASAVATAQNHHQPYTALLNELAQVIHIDLPRYNISQAYHMIGRRTHAPYEVVLFIDQWIIKTPEPFDSLQDAKNWCANQAIITLVQHYCGITQWTGLDTRNDNNHAYNYQIEEEQYRLQYQHISQRPSSTMNISTVVDDDDASVINLISNNDDHTNSAPTPTPTPTPTSPISSVQGNKVDKGKKPYVLAYDKTEIAILNEVVSKSKWENPHYDIEERKSDNTIHRCIYRCSIKLHRPPEVGGDITVQGVEWCPSKNQAKRHTASLVLDGLVREDLCVIVHTT